MPLPRVSQQTHRVLVTITSLVIVGPLTCGLPAVAQLPQARLSSLSRPGVRSGESAEITLRGTDLEGVTQLWFDHPGLKATHVKDLTFRITSSPDIPLGHHDVRAVGTFGVSNPRTLVVSDRPEMIEVEPNNTPDKATPIVVGTVIFGEISAATEIDCYSFDGKKGQRVFLDLQAERIDSRLDATLRVLNATGTELAESRDVFGADPFLDLTLPADGRYLIKVHDAVYAGSAEHVYRLLVDEGPHPDAILPLAATPGSTGAYTLVGRNLGTGATADAALKVDGRPLEHLTLSISVPATDSFDTNHIRRYVPSAAGVPRPEFDYAFTRLSQRGEAPVTSGPFAIAAVLGTIILEKEPNNEEAQAQTVVPPCDISGTFGVPGDVDLYRFQGRKGEVWKIEAIAERQGSLADPALDPEGRYQGTTSARPGQCRRLARRRRGARFNTQSVDAEVRFQVPDDDLYQVQISDLYASQRGDPRLTYRLVIRPEKPDFQIVLVPNSAAGIDAVTIRAGGRTSAYVAAIRLDGFAGPIRVEATDLPPGVQCDPVVIGQGQVLTPIVFEAAENAKSGLGSVSLVGLARFGDRKAELTYTSGATSLGPELTHQAFAGGMTGPPNASVATMAPCGSSMAS